MSYDDLKPPVLAPEEVREATIFSKTLLYEQHDDATSPLMLVGLPRSGSSFAADLISQSKSYYVFDDLYMKEICEGFGCSGPMTKGQFEKVLFQSGWIIRSRIRFKNYAVPHMLQTDVDIMNESLNTAYNGAYPDWPSFQQEWLIRLTQLNGCEHWGFNYPKGFLMLDTYRRYYPNLRTVFLIRSPEKVLSSYKHMYKGHNDGDPARYHPIFYAWYWRKSVRSYLVEKQNAPEKTYLLLFEDLVKKPEDALKGIAEFFNFKIRAPIEPAKANTSFSKKRKSLTGLELFLLRKIAGQEMAELGYGTENVKIKAGDFFDFVYITCRWALFHIKQRLKRR